MMRIMARFSVSTSCWRTPASSVPRADGSSACREMDAGVRQHDGARAVRLVRGPVSAALLALAACGLQPVYSGGGSGPVAQALSDIAIAPIPDRAGYLVRNALAQRLGEPAATPHLRLEVELDDAIIGFGVRGDNSIARERRTLRARYRVVAVATGVVLLDATAGADAGIDRVSSDYAVVAAETSALDRLAVEVARQIAARIGAAARGGTLYPAGPTRPTP